jgi:hypothetical protein
MKELRFFSLHYLSAGDTEHLSTVLAGCPQRSGCHLLDRSQSQLENMVPQEACYSRACLPEVEQAENSRQSVPEGSREKQNRQDSGDTIPRGGRFKAEYAL